MCRYSCPIVIVPLLFEYKKNRATCTCIFSSSTFLISFFLYKHTESSPSCVIHPFHSFRNSTLTHIHTHTLLHSYTMFNNSGLLVLLSQRFGHISSSNRHSRQYHQLEDARQWFYCMQCDVGFGSRDRHEWHLQVCPATRRCRKQQLLSPSCCQ